MIGIPSYLYVVAFVVVFGLAWAFHRAGDHSRKTVEFVGIAIGVAVALLQLQAAMVQARGTMLQVVHAVDQSREDVQHRRLDVSFQLMATWNEPDVVEAARVVRPVLKSATGKAPAEILALLQKEEAKGQAFKKIFDFFENVGLAVRVGYADRPTLCLYYAKAVERYYATFEGYVGALRATQPGLYEQFEWLYREWKKSCPALPATSS